MKVSTESKNSRALLLAAALGMVLSPFTVYADDGAAPRNEVSPAAAPTGTNPAAPQEQLTTIVITATKRTTTDQDTPISLTAVTGEELTSRGITDFQTLARSVPGLSVRDAGAGQSEFEMRGVYGLGGNSSVVGFYIDEIPLASPAFSNWGKTDINPNLYDLERVEVLRGPQGTLYGSSSLAGTIRLIPSPPQLNTYSLSAEEVLSDTSSGGSINHQQNVMMNLPMGDTAALRIVGSITDNSGWIERRVIANGAVTTDPGVYPNVSRPNNFYSAPLQEDLSGVNTTSVDSIRAAILWKPLDNVTIEPTVMYQRTELGAAPVVDVSGDSTDPQTPTVKAHWEPYDVPEPQTDSFTFGSLKAVDQLSNLSLTSATGLWHRNAILTQDGVEGVNSVFGIPAYNASAGGLGPLGPEPNGPGATEQDAEWQLSEELRITSTAPGPLQWVAGYFYQDLHSQFNQYLVSPEAAPVVGAPPWMFVDFQPQVITQNAFFGDVTWQLSPHFNVEAGLRHYHYSLSNSDTEYGVFAPNAFLGNSVPYNVSFSNQASGTLPEFTLTYNVTQDDMVYAKVSKGIRIGGANNPAPVAPVGSNNAFAVAVECGLQAKVLLTTTCNPNIFLQTPTTFGSDTLWSYELGWKSSFFEHRMTVDLAAYYERWGDPQLPTNIAGFFLDANGGNADIKGVEGQLRTLLPLGFELSLTSAYTHTEFVQTSTIIGFPEGMQIPDTPEFTGSAVLRWNHELANGRSLFGSLEENYVGSRISEPIGVTATVLNINQVLVHLPGYNIVNLRFGISGEANAGATWTAALFANNLLNNQALLDPQPNQGVQTAAFQRYTINQPLTAGIDVTYRFH